MPHKQRGKRNHIQVKNILANSELSLIDKKKGRKSFERVPRHENNPHDRRIEEKILNDDDDSEDERKELKKHIVQELQQTDSVIPKKSRKNKYYLLNHPELKDVIPIVSKTNKRKHQPDEEKEKEAVKKIVTEENKPSICDKLVSHMITSRFRYLNEKLYTSTSTDAQKLFQIDPQSFYAYHQGYSVSSFQFSSLSSHYSVLG